MNRIMLLLLLIIGCATTAIAGGYSYVEQDQFKRWLGNKKNLTIVDIQVPVEFQKHHFKGALETGAYPVKSLEDKGKLDKVMPRLLGSQNDLVIVCPGGGGGAKNTYDYLKEKGISEKRLFILEKGMQGWPYRELTVAGK